MARYSRGYRRSSPRRVTRRTSSAGGYRRSYAGARRRTSTRRGSRRAASAQTVRVVIQQAPAQPVVMGGAVSMTALKKARF